MIFCHSKHIKVWDRIANNIEKHVRHMHTDQYVFLPGTIVSSFVQCFPRSNSNLIKRKNFCCEAAKWSRKFAVNGEHCACPLYWGRVPLDDVTPEGMEVLPCEFYFDSPYYKLINLITTKEALKELAEQVRDAPIDERHKHIYEVM